jgi:hypothetical protein
MASFFNDLTLAEGNSETGRCVSVDAIRAQSPEARRAPPTNSRVIRPCDHGSALVETHTGSFSLTGAAAAWS